MKQGIKSVKKGLGKVKNRVNLKSFLLLFLAICLIISVISLINRSSYERGAKYKAIYSENLFPQSSSKYYSKIDKCGGFIIDSKKEFEQIFADEIGGEKTPIIDFSKQMVVGYKVCPMKECGEKHTVYWLQNEDNDNYEYYLMKGPQSACEALISSLNLILVDKVSKNKVFWTVVENGEFDDVSTMLITLADAVDHSYAVEYFSKNGLEYTQSGGWDYFNILVNVDPTEYEKKIEDIKKEDRVINVKYDERLSNDKNAVLYVSFDFKVETEEAKAILLKDSELEIRSVIRVNKYGTIKVWPSMKEQWLEKLSKEEFIKSGSVEKEIYLLSRIAREELSGLNSSERRRQQTGLIPRLS
jgi:hypothetical protein